MEFSIKSKDHTYTLKHYDPNYSNDFIDNKENKIHLNYFRNLLSSTYDDLSNQNNQNNQNSYKKCMEEFDNICYFWHYSCDLWYSYYDFEFSEIKTLINTHEFLKIFKAYLQQFKK